MARFFDIDRVEYIVTKRCTGWCQHCSVVTDDRNPDRSYQDIDAVLRASGYLFNEFAIRSVMAYGGEPLLYTDNTCRLYELARDNEIQQRELITNGYFSRNASVITSVASKILAAGVNRIFLSVDAFHQPRIPLAPVELFISALLDRGCNDLHLHPSWVVNRDYENEFNRRTEQLLRDLTDRYGVPTSRGNDIVPAGFFRHTLSAHYPRLPSLPKQMCDEIPYANSPTRIRSLRMLPSGDVHICRGVSIGNLNMVDIATLISEYDPYSNPLLARVLHEGVEGIVSVAKETGIQVNADDYYGRCDLCAHCIRAILGKQAQQGV